ncbi:hypothetical protein [Marinifilum flexuosum]|uniref:DUF4412 domain-containing protein n=1 Tax=Marinifilum flexuosum TaxID=1117708 RepID=A0A419X7A3_9BACT|nr:hypothetical protein [Marinifilum flexuosum]RKE03638.1 hypothetical protein BXY64_0647 [Marinifilum flexuosum]
MNKLILAIVIMAGTISCRGNAKDKVKRYEVKSGIVQYSTTISGKVMGSTISGKGTESLYFKAYGALELKEEKSERTTTTKIFGQQNTETEYTHTMNKLDNKMSYTVDFDNKVIYKNQDMAMSAIKAFHLNADAGDAGRKMLEGMGGKKTGAESILGHSCEIWDLAGVRQWIYKGVTLKSEATIMGITTTTIATSAKFNVSVADKYFQLPNFPEKEMEVGMSGDGGAAVMQSLFEDMDEDDEGNGMEDLKRAARMSFAEFKREAKQDEEMSRMSDDDLRHQHNMIKKMARGEQLSFEEWKRMVVASDKELGNMSDEQLWQMYEMSKNMQQIIK